jgi:hypothetical protein|nr:hypothetical protein [bacterium]
MKKSAIEKFSRKIGLYKPENERTKAQKICRDVAFFAVVIYAAVISFLYFDAESRIIENECGSYSQSVTSQVALNK